jgi:hypothetical protein
MATGNSSQSKGGSVKKPPYFEEAIDLALLIVAVGSLLVAVSI